MAAYPPPDPPYFTDINFNPSFYNTITGAFITASQVAAKYLNKITGGTITGLLRIIYSTADQSQFQIQNTNDTSISSLLIKNNNSTASTGIGQFGVNNTSIPYLTNKAFITSSTDLSIITNNNFATPTLQILGNRNVGLGIPNPSSLLHLHNPNSAGEVRISFSDNSSGTTVTDGFAIIKEAGEDVAIWNYENNAIRFGTHNTEQIRILNNGNIGIGTSDPGTYRLRIRGSANNTFLRVETSISDVNQVSGIEFGIPAFPTTGSAKILSTSISGDKADLKFYTSSGLTNSSVKMTILPDGNIGIGTNNPNGVLELYSTTQNISRIILSGQEFYQPSNTSTSGVALLCGVNRTGNRQMWIGDSANLTQNSTNPVLRLLTNSIDSIATDGQTPLNFSVGNGATTTSIFGAPVLINNGSGGNVGISTNTANNILQVGSGGRLRIANNTADYSLIGSKDVDDANNTRIVVSGNARSGLTGYIEYISTTASGTHRFTNNGIVTLSINETSVTFTRPLSITDYPLYVLGQFVVLSSKVNTASQTKNGYFISLTNLLDASIHIAASHNSTSYTYWHGNVSTNSVGGVITINPTAQSNMNMEAFQENGTNARFLYIVPNVAFNIGVNLKIRYIG